jgi:two-component system KDP operon response regulator KdpE
MTGARILVVDDEPQLHRFLKPALEAAGYEVERADSAAEGLRLAATRSPAAVLLDLGLPDMDGQVVLEKLRAFSQVPILIISARDREAEKIRALDSGADDYVEKPFALGELLARLRACLRRVLVQEGAAEIWRSGGVEVDLVRRRVRTEGQELTLSPRDAGRVLTHRQLLMAVWGKGHAEDLQYLRVYVGHLRQKLGPHGATLIGTEAGIGYRLVEGDAAA